MNSGLERRICRTDWKTSNCWSWLIWSNSVYRAQNTPVHLTPRLELQEIIILDISKYRCICCCFLKCILNFYYNFFFKRGSVTNMQWTRIGVCWPSVLSSAFAISYSWEKILAFCLSPITLSPRSHCRYMCLIFLFCKIKKK